MQYKICFTGKAGTNERIVFSEGCSSLDAQKNFEKTLSPLAYKKLLINEIKPVREKDAPYELPIRILNADNDFILKASAKISCIVKEKAIEFLENKVEKSIQESLQELLKLVWNNGYNAALKAANEMIYQSEQD